MLEMISDSSCITTESPPRDSISSNRPTVTIPKYYFTPTAQTSPPVPTKRSLQDTDEILAYGAQSDTFYASPRTELKVEVYVILRPYLTSR
jgi:hypothetical protein